MMAMNLCGQATGADTPSWLEAVAPNEARWLNGGVGVQRALGVKMLTINCNISSLSPDGELCYMPIISCNLTIVSNMITNTV